MANTAFDGKPDRTSVGRFAVAAAIGCAAFAAQAKTLVYYSMANDAEDGVIVNTTTFTNSASASNEFFGQIDRNNRYHSVVTPWATNGFETGWYVQNGIYGSLQANPEALCLPINWENPDKSYNGQWPDNQDGAALCVNDPDRKLDLQTFTVECFIKTKRYTNWHSIFCKPADSMSEKQTISLIETSYSKSNTSLQLYYAYVDAAGNCATGDITLYNSSSPCIQDGNWHHVALSVDGETHGVFLYLDGELKGSGILKGLLHFGTNPDLGRWHVGGNPLADHAWGGVIDEFRLSDTVLIPESLLRRTQTDVSQGTTRWTTAASGNFSVAANWSEGVPNATLPGVIAVESSDPVTVTLDGNETVGSVAVFNLSSTNVLNVTGALTVKDDTLKASVGGRVEVNGGSLFVTNGCLNATVGGRISLAGGTVAITNGQLAASGGTVEISGGELVVSNALVSTKPFAFTAGSKLRMSGGHVVYCCGQQLKDYNVFSGSKVDITGGIFDFCNFKDKCGFSKCWFQTDGTDISLSGDAQMNLVWVQLNASQPGVTNVFSVRENAVLGPKDDSYFIVGSKSNGGHMVLDLGSSKNINIPYGMLVGSGHDGTANLRNGQFLSSGGNDVNAGYGNGRTGTINVYDGCLDNRGRTQYAYHLYGLSLGHPRNTKLTGQTSVRRGFLNVYPDGVVTNSGACHFLVGVGKAEGKVTQYGGSIQHRASFQPVFGWCGGTGSWTMMSNSVAYVSSDMYLGGAITNDLLSFTNYAANHNGGADFKLYYALTNYTGLGTLDLEGGTFACAKTLYMSVSGTGEIRFGPNPGALLTAETLCLSNVVDSTADPGNPVRRVSTLSYRLGPEGSGHAEVTNLVLSAGAVLSVDVTEFPAQQRGWYPLVTYSDCEGEFAEIRYEGEPGSGEVKKCSHAGRMGYWFARPQGFTLLFR